MNTYNKLKMCCVALLLPAISFAQDKPVAVAVKSTSAFSNPLLIALISIAVMLLIVIVVFAEVVKASAQNKINLKNAKRATNSTASKLLLISVGLTALSNSALAQATNAVAPVIANTANDSGYLGLSAGIFYLMLVTICIELAIAWKLYDIAMDLLGENERKQVAAKAKAISNEPSFIEKINASVAIEEEATIMLGHDYDGIRELDNDLPPWWKYGFYLTILFSVVYLFNYHVSKTGNLQLEEYENEIAQAKIEVDEYMKTSANNVDENTVKLLTEASQISTGKETFIANCVACHGAGGEGTVGPNLTDNYWIHGGSVADIFKSIKYGWVEKGMKSWKEDLSPMQIAQLTSYIKTLNGTNPANAKAPQGDLFNDTTTGTIATGDSLAVPKTDSVVTIIK